MTWFTRLVHASLAVVGFIVINAAYAAGPHEGLDCLGCHDPHYAKANKLFKVENTVYPNPRTGKPIDGISALCLGCHNLPEYGGAGVRPIYLHMTHPVNVVPNAKIAEVDAKLLRDGILQCVSCHDPHPSNPNWKYLRVDTSGGGKVGQFCALCHGAKADKKFYGGDLAQTGKPQVFTSMNEAAGAGTFTLQDAKFVTNNPTPSYISPMGTFENTLAPAYVTVASKPWVFSSKDHNVPADLKAAVQNAAKAAPTAPAAPARTTTGAQSAPVQNTAPAATGLR